MNVYYLLIAVLIIEIIFLILLGFSFVIERVVLTNIEKRKIRAYDAISRLIIKSIHHEHPSDLINSLASFSRETLLSVMEAYDRRLNDEDWIHLKRSISETVLLPLARKLKTAIFWEKRDFCSRCLALSPSPEDQETMLFLMNDPIFLVRSNAALAIARLGIKPGIEKIIKKMAEEPGYGYYFYRDILLQSATPETFSYIAEIIGSNHISISMHLAGLDILSGKMITLHSPQIKEDLKSTNNEVRAAAVRIFSKNPQKDSLKVLLQYLEDPDPIIRSESAHGLRSFPSPEVIEKLQKALNDSCWEVSLQAAWSLKHMGKTGLAILKGQNPYANKEALNVAKFAIQFDW